MIKAFILSVAVLFGISPIQADYLLPVKHNAAGGSFSFVQFLDKSSSGTTDNLTLVSNVGVGDLLVVAVRGGTTGLTFTASDNLDGSWVNDFNHTVQTDHSIGFLHIRVTTAGTVTVTVTQSSSASLRFIVAHFTGLASSSYTDGTAAATDAASGGNMTSPSMTTSFDSSLVIGMASTALGSSTITAGTGYNLIDDLQDKLAMQYQILTPAGATTSTMNMSGDIWGAGIAGFKHS